MGVPIVHYHSLTMKKHRISYYELIITRIKKESNRMLIYRSRYYILRLAHKQALAVGKELISTEEQNLLFNNIYKRDDEISDKE